jgi:hypothetical protein
MIGSMREGEQKTAPDVAAPGETKTDSSSTPPTAYIPACGTLCDAFWWARPGRAPESSD